MSRGGRPPVAACQPATRFGLRRKASASLVPYAAALDAEGVRMLRTICCATGRSVRVSVAEARTALVPASAARERTRQAIQATSKQGCTERAARPRSRARGAPSSQRARPQVSLATAASRFSSWRRIWRFVASAGGCPAAPASPAAPRRSSRVSCDIAFCACWGSWSCFACGSSLRIALASSGFVRSIAALDAFSSQRGGTAPST